MYQVNEGKGEGYIFLYLINIHDQIYLFTPYLDLSKWSQTWQLL